MLHGKNGLAEVRSVAKKLANRSKNNFVGSSK